MRNAPITRTWHGISRQREQRHARQRDCDCTACGNWARRRSAAAAVPGPAR